MYTRPYPMDGSLWGQPNVTGGVDIHCEKIACNVTFNMQYPDLNLYTTLLPGMVGSFPEPIYNTDDCRGKYTIEGNDDVGGKCIVTC